jgi:hypothetical protein
MAPRLRISQSFGFGPFRFRVSVPLGKGRTWVGASTRDGIGRLGVSAPVGKRGGRRRSR